MDQRTYLRSDVDLTDEDSKVPYPVEANAVRSTGQAQHLPNSHLPPEALCQKKYPSTIISTLNTAVQAASTGDDERLEDLIEDFWRALTDAAVAAAANGHFGCVMMIHDRVHGPGEYIGLAGVEVMREAVTAAAANGHTEIVSFLLPALTSDGEIDEVGTWNALINGAAHGHLSVVKAAAEDAAPYDFMFKHNVTTAMLKAMSGGFVDVVEFLLTWEHWKGDAGKVFEVAMAKGQHEVAEKVYEVYPQVKPERNLFIDMAERGNVEAIKYLHDNGHRDLSLLEEARRCAVLYQHTAVVKFLELVLSEPTAPAF